MLVKLVTKTSTINGKLNSNENRNKIQFLSFSHKEKKNLNYYYSDEQNGQSQYNGILIDYRRFFFFFN